MRRARGRRRSRAPGLGIRRPFGGTGYGAIPLDAGVEIRGFSSPDHAALPVDFDLYRADNQVPGGSYYEPFDAWLVPR
ncbi:hypothetical protein QHF85_20070 [Polyangium sp. 6x1]|nr:hypothetical protein [Polyangium sp. 6x1]